MEPEWTFHERRYVFVFVFLFVSVFVFVFICICVCVVFVFVWCGFEFSAHISRPICGIDCL